MNGDPTEPVVRLVVAESWVRGFLCGTSALRAVDDVMVSKLRLTDTKCLDLYGCLTFKNLHFLC